MSKQFDSAWLDKYEQRTKQNNINRAVSRAFPEPIVQHEPVAAKEREASHSGRIHVRVISYRRRLCDPDNLCPKYFIDCLRYAQIIPDDRAKDITLEVSQEKSNDERTEIEVLSP